MTRPDNLIKINQGYILEKAMTDINTQKLISHRNEVDGATAPGW